ncbi:MAG: methyltransferase domain-containing protein [Phycisphaerae bacterium]
MPPAADTPAPRSGSDSAAGACTISPEIYDIAFGWNPLPEVQRLLLLAREAGIEPRSALELGCGTGRLLAALRALCPDAAGLELSPEMAALAAQRSGAEIVVGDMTTFELGRRFDLLYTSANTIRHATDDASITGLWRCAAAHLNPGGVFIADLELGFADEAGKVGKPATWMLARGETLVHVQWIVATPPDPVSRTVEIEWVFEARGPQPGEWRQRFALRVFDAGEFVQRATREHALGLVGIFELRDPYLLPRPIEKAVGRSLVVLQRA